METLIEYLKDHKPKGFSPKPHYSAEGDSLTFYIKDVAYYRKRIDGFLTVYRSMDTDELIGCQIKGLATALELLGNFGVFIKDGNVTLGMIFMACMAESPEAEAKDCYRELGRVAGRTQIPRDELQPLLN